MNDAMGSETGHDVELRHTTATELQDVEANMEHTGVATDEVQRFIDEIRSLRQRLGMAQTIACLLHAQTHATAKQYPDVSFATYIALDQTTRELSLHHDWIPNYDEEDDNDG